VQKCFPAPGSTPFPFVPDLTAQLDVFRGFMALGNIVQRTADAWLRVADFEGPNSKRALSMAGMCQRALDARKLAATFDFEELKRLKLVLRDFKNPHWRSGRAIGPKSHSILGNMHERWKGWLVSVEAASPRRDEIPTEMDDEKSQYSVISVEKECVVCLAREEIKCTQCGDGLCSVWCEGMHWGASHPSLLVKTFIPTIIPTKLQAASGATTTHSKSALEILIDVTFGRKRPVCDGAKLIDYSCLRKQDIMALAEMVQVEYSNSLQDAISKARGPSNDEIRMFDVFVNTSLYSQGGEKAICTRDPYDYFRLGWLEKNDNFLPLGEGKYDCKVASLSGPQRILESLMAAAEPAVGSLTYYAKRREMLVDVVETTGGPLKPAIANSLNESQRKVVATVINPNFRSGFFAVQGPPG
jgi:hypothetical protein